MSPRQVPRSLSGVVTALAVAAYGLIMVCVLTGAPCHANANAARADRAEGPAVSSIATAPVTIYGAKWCSACKSLERGLTERKIAFDLVDVDENPSAYARARSSSGEGNAIPLTSIVTPSKTVWIVGADIDGVDRAQRAP